MQARAVWNFIAWLSGALALSSAIVTPFVAGLGVQIYLPDITIGGISFRPNLVQIGYFVAIAYALAQLIETLTPPGSSGFQTFARIASRIALVSFAITLIAMCVQLGVDASNVRELMRQSSPFTLVIGLFLVALADVTVLPWLKRLIYGAGASTSVVPVQRNVVHEHQVAGGDVSYRGAPLIGHADRAQIMYFDAAGGDLDIEFEGGAPRRLRVTHPVSPERDAA